MEPQTLLEYLTFVKGVGYLLVVAYLFAFLTFWQLIHIKEKEVVRVVSVIVIMWLTFGVTSALVMNGNASAEITSSVPEVTSSSSGTVFPEYYSNGTPATITAHRTEKWLGINASDYSAISYGSAMGFHTIMSEKIECRDCHHNSGDEIHACKDCHSVPFDPDNMDKPGLKAAIHKKCMSCHKEVFNGPDSCRSCHTINVPESATVSAPARPHELTWEDCTRCHKEGIPGDIQTNIVYHNFCVKCHTKGINGAPLVPADHAGRTVDTCSGCHRPAGGN